MQSIPFKNRQGECPPEAVRSAPKTPARVALPIGLALVLPALAQSGCREGTVFQPPPPPPVTVAAPEQRPVTTHQEFTGRTAAVDTVEIRARVSGFLEKRHFSASDKVEADQLLFEIEPERFEAAVKSAEAELAQRLAARDLANVTLERAQAAFEKEAVTDLELRQKSAERDAAQAAYDAAQAEVDAARLELSYTSIKAPISGRVSRSYVDAGNLVGSGEATLLTTIIVDDPIHAYFNVDERFILEYLKEGTRSSEMAPEDRPTVTLQLADGRVYEHAGRIDFGDNTLDPDTGTLMARGVFPNPDGKLFPGLFVRVLFAEDAGPSILVPERSLQRDLVGSFVLVVADGNTVERRDVELGPKVDRERVIESGLDGSEQVIINGLQRARPGIVVTPG